MDFKRLLVLVSRVKYILALIDGHSGRFVNVYEQHIILYNQTG